MNNMTEQHVADIKEMDSCISNKSPMIESFTEGCFIFEKVNSLCRHQSQYPDPVELWGRLWFEGEIACLFSDSNLGKSIYAVQIATSIAEKQPVIYYDFELSSKQFQSRYAKPDGTCYNFPETLYRAHIDPHSITDAVHYDKLPMLLVSGAQRVGAKVLIIDNLTFLCNESESGVAAMELMTQLCELKHAYGLSILVLAHTPKRDLSQPITANDLAGSKRLFNFFDSVFAIGNSTIDENSRYLKQLKARQCGIAFGSNNVVTLEIRKADDGGLFMWAVEYGAESEHLKKVIGNTISDRYCQEITELTSQNLTCREIAERLHISKATVSRVQQKIRHEYIKPLSEN